MSCKKQISSQKSTFLLFGNAPSSDQLFTGLYAVFFSDAMRNNPHKVMGTFVSSETPLLFHTFFLIERLRYFRKVFFLKYHYGISRVVQTKNRVKE
ncbi:MAG: hypothetical protein D3917_13735 [Candidatus Electrothrix sp. AX5]|nr:hypothetical protein [Candidatus Electrothrix sp. AX5]